VANRIEPFEVTVPAGTASSAPQRTSLAFPDGEAVRLEIRMPPGPSGLVGFQVHYSGQSVIPYRGSTFIKGDDERFDWDLERYPERGDWELLAYNTDIYDHTLYLRFHVVDRMSAVPRSVPILDIVEIPEAMAE
jgi:hypothetical protein